MTDGPTSWLIPGAECVLLGDKHTDEFGAITHDVLHLQCVAWTTDERVAILDNGYEVFLDRRTPEGNYLLGTKFFRFLDSRILRRPYDPEVAQAEFDNRFGSDSATRMLLSETDVRFRIPWPDADTRRRLAAQQHVVTVLRVWVEAARGDALAPAGSWMEELIRTPQGQLALIAAAAAATIESSRSWRHPMLDGGPVLRIDLPSEVAAIAESARSLRAAIDSLGPCPGGTLAMDPEVRAEYGRHAALLEQRHLALRHRVSALHRYRDGIRDLDLRLERLNWLERTGPEADLSHHVALVSDRLASESLAESEAMTSVVMGSLIEDAQYLSRILKD